MAAPGVVRNFCAEGRSGILVATDAGLALIANRRLLPIAMPVGLRSPNMLACQFDGAGSLWLLTRQDGLFRRRAGAWAKILQPEQIGAASPRLMVLDGDGGVWLGTDGGGLALFAGGRLRRFSPAQGLKIGFAQTALPLKGMMLFGGELGLALFDGKSFRSLTKNEHAALSLISGIAVDLDGNLWTSGNRGVGLLRDVSATSLFEKPANLRRLIQLDYRSGLPGYPQISCCTNTIMTALSGRLWFLTNQGVAALDPTDLRLPSTAVRPIIRSVVSDGKNLPTSGDTKLSAGYPNLRIDYTSDSLANADQVEFRYRLVGIDASWSDAGQRRQAFYPELRDGSYQFLLQAKVPGGSWSDRQAEVNLVVPPTFLQTPWPKILAAALVILLMVVIYWARVRYAMDIVEKRLTERMRERERIARELHDTLLQSVQALVLRIDDAKQEIPPGLAAHGRLEKSLQEAEKVLEEARDTVSGLRSFESSDDFEDVFRQITQKLPFAPEVDISISTAGRPRRLSPEVCEEIARIANEALLNVYRHARTARVEISMTFHPSKVVLSIVDHGVGIPPSIMASGKRAGHFGLIGMRERAERIGADLRVESEPGRGTTVKLAVPAAIAHHRPSLRLFLRNLRSRTDPSIEENAGRTQGRAARPLARR